MKKEIPTEREGQYKANCLKCVWNNLRGYSKVVIFCSLMKCKLNQEADNFKKYRK